MPGNTGRSGVFVAPRLGGSCTCDPVPYDGIPPLVGSLRDGGKPWRRPGCENLVVVLAPQREKEEREAKFARIAAKIQPKGVKLISIDTWGWAR
jgi:hypothetical protein